MAKDAKAAQQTEHEGPPEFSKKAQDGARQWFAKAEKERDKRDYDYAIECYLTGLEYWPTAIEEGYTPLWALAVQRQQAGGKPVGKFEELKRGMGGKDAKKALINATYLMAKDPGKATYLDGVLKNATKAGYLPVVQWVAPKVYDSLRRDKKPNTGRFKVFRQQMVEAARKADEWGDIPTSAWCYEQAVNAIDYLVARNPTDMALKDEQRDLSGKLTIAKGKYDSGDSFRDSIKDADSQKRLHDADRVKQGEQTQAEVIAAAKREYEENADVPAKIFAYVTALERTEKSKLEKEAIRVLEQAYADSRSYAFKQRADDIRMKMLRRRRRAWEARAQQTNSEDDQQNARLAAMEERQTVLDIFRDRVANYPTDLKLKAKLGQALFASGEYDEAIPILQAAQGDPRTRAQSQLLMGRAFFEKEVYSQAAEVLREAFDAKEVTSDEVGKEIQYWLGRAYQAEGQLAEAKAVFGKLARADYNYRDGDVRKRMDELK